MIAAKVTWLSLKLGAVSATLIACGRTTENWQEEVELSDARVITVEREVTWRESTPWGQAKQYLTRETRLAFVPSQGQRTVTWNGWAEHLLVLDFDSVRREYVLVTRPGTCERYLDVGRPRPPYLVYRLRDAGWTSVDFTADLVGKKANMLVFPDVAGEPALVTVNRKTETQTGLPTQVRALVSTGGMAPC